MAIDFEDSEKRKSYLSEKLDDLLNGINDSYGTVLMDELMSRLERTVAEFNGEVKSLMEQLKASSEKREDLLEKIESGDFEVEEEGEKEPGRELSEWEKRLEEIGKDKS